MTWMFLIKQHSKTSFIDSGEAHMAIIFKWLKLVWHYSLFLVAVCIHQIWKFNQFTIILYLVILLSQLFLKLKSPLIFDSCLTHFCLLNEVCWDSILLKILFISMHLTAMMRNALCFWLAITAQSMILKEPHILA